MFLCLDAYIDEQDIYKMTIHRIKCRDLPRPQKTIQTGSKRSTGSIPFSSSCSSSPYIPE